jgi:hypothetical protein
MTIISQFDTFKGSHVTKLAPQSESCQVCGWYGYPGQKIIREFKGIRSEDEEGFVDKFTE